ncbi:YheV family putative zinc ribbon protein [Edwardsiella piscicida]|uniref:YheV family putative zinc ribbon protein n=1 Tax=Edwardsiella piscicida TaxID=1263550 RepID=UPI00370D8F71
MKKRFIAGARCPACHAMDTLALWQVNEHEHEHEHEQVQCVRCGHRMTPPAPAGAPGRIIGRFKP